MMQQHYVTFYSPGTFFAETARRKVDSWDVDVAAEMARSVLERHNACPYGFQFSTYGRNDDELDSREIARSQFYWLGGKIETLADVKSRNDPAEKILRGNMECNGWDRIITNTNSWKWTQPLKEGDVVLEWSK